MWEKKIFQVALPTHNNAKTISRCLKSIDECLKNEEWHLIVGDNNSTDDTVDIVKNSLPNLSCQTNLVLEFPDSTNSAAAKNRVLNICGSFAIDRPCVLGMDPHGLMLPDRVKLYDQAKEKNIPFIVGSWIWSINEQKFKQNNYKKKNIDQCVKELQFTWACTLIHSHLLNPGGQMFDDQLDFYEDVIYWNEIQHLPYNFKIIGADLLKPVFHYVVDDEAENIFQSSKKSFETRDIVWERIKEIKDQGKIIDSEKMPEQSKKEALKKANILEESLKPANLEE